MMSFVDDTEHPPDWLRQVRDRVVTWATTVMSTDHAGLFRMCADAHVPWDLQSSAKGLHILQRHDALDVVPNGTDRAETIRFIQALQDEETGFFRDPLFEEHFACKDDPDELLKLRRNNAKWASIALRAFDAEPLWPFFRTGTSGGPDPEAVLAMIRNGDWTQPWGIGSHASQGVRELFFLACEGRDDLVPYVGRGLTMILARQNPYTGMIGDSSLPLFQQISGALKVIGNFQFSLGLKVPYLRQLADACVTHHADGSFYAQSNSHSIPRNVAEIAWVCLIHSDYRRDELRSTLADIARHYHEIFGKPDGGYSPTPEGTQPYGWNGTILSEPSPTPRSSISGTNGSGCLGMICAALGWDVGFPSMHDGWQDRVARLRYQIELSSGGTARLVPREGV
ncbi:MAG: hypothetical protein QF402_01565 [Candidatus Latescibacteria bacterium]|jgi:hypothetical protein|nr:hypothetical protein [Candidatus Latescibacterota bacterium]|tara:strand:- start:1628 stop:2815 length:1188 start_codon:yes stop_codon:yes gene_type:complete